MGASSNGNPGNNMLSIFINGTGIVVYRLILQPDPFTKDANLQSERKEICKLILNQGPYGYNYRYL
jgi:hypothetical protein